MRFEAVVEVRTRPGIADPEGATIESALPALGFSDVADVRVGKAFRLSVEAEDEGAARARVHALCDALLANPVMEEFDVRFEQPEAAEAR
ncbi:MAG TPA: phosphoribosylformylglycinamidine synthase subunit PurS [Acidimicrobiales bacterium]|nr:phosphoribosylformylglycinamidine synthase subunit PurS [Acidimicrobiales bacterium]